MNQNSPGHHLNLGRRLGFDDNPLRRRTDRLQAWARLAVMLLFVVVCFGGIVAGLIAYDRELANEQTDRQYGYQATGQILNTSPSYAAHDSGTSSATIRVGWRDTQERRLTQRLTVTHRVDAGDRIQLWINANGKASTTPPGHDETIAVSMLKGLGVTLLLAFFLVVAYSAFAYALDRNRQKALADEWEVVEPQWRREVL